MISLLSIRPPYLRRQNGFSLVEVTLSIGIVAFAFITLFGLIPTGLNVFRGAIDASMGTQISQQVLEGVRQTDYEALRLKSQLTDDGSKRMDDTYYDDQGNLLTDNSVPPVPITDYKDPRSIYTVRTVVIMPTSVPLKADASSNNAVTTTNNVARIIVKIAKNPGRLQNPFTANNQGNVTVYTSYIARNLSAFSYENQGQN